MSEDRAVMRSELNALLTDVQEILEKARKNHTALYEAMKLYAPGEVKPDWSITQLVEYLPTLLSDVVLSAYWRGHEDGQEAEREVQA